MRSLRASERAYERDEALKRKSPGQRATAARARLMGQCLQVGRVNARHRCENTLPLFPLWLILDADESLSADLRGLVERTQA